jgi:predicted AlkP superfamily phosphohydrolase/phosphomutase
MMRSCPHRQRRRMRHGAAHRFLLAAAAFLALSATGAHASGKKVIVLGFDGLDPDRVRDMIADGRLPNLARMQKTGWLQDLGTSVPPQSPVAWSNFITGMDSGGHGIFDFLHRHPDTMIPYLSTSEPLKVTRSVDLGKYQIPLGGGGYALLRHGTPFWETLEDNGVRTMIIRMPANFPVTGKATYELSGMSTPDVRGTYGTFSYYTTDRKEKADLGHVGGGVVYAVRVRNGQVKATLEGPPDPYLIPPKRGSAPRASAEFTVDVDPDEPSALIRVDDQELLLRQGEWSDWIPFDLSLSLLQSIPVTARFYLKEVHPELRLYVTPLNFDPENPKIPIEHPKGFGREIAKSMGRFYSQGFPEDTKALDTGVLTIGEFVEQSTISGNEILDEYPWFLDKFEKEFKDKDALLFYYTGNLDQVSHMMYRCLDPTEPGYDPAVHAKYAHVIPDIIERLDHIVGLTLDRFGNDATVIVMSDHGFGSWKRAMNLNTWLYQQGYLALKDPDIAKDPGLFLNVDWTRTRAYGLGLNGLYVNLRGRERNGIVAPEDKQGLLEDIAQKLVKVTDPKTGKHAVNKVYLSDVAYHDRGALDVGPDAIVGYAFEYRASNQSAMGEFPKEIFADNLDQWSGDHCMDPATVPGTLAVNHPLQKPAPNLQSLASAILAEFGVGKDFPGAAEDLRSVGYISAPATH